MATQRARVFWARRAFATVAAITTTSGAAWRWRITDGDGTALEESDEFFLTITAALAGGRTSSGSASPSMRWADVSPASMSPASMRWKSIPSKTLSRNH